MKAKLTVVAGPIKESEILLENFPLTIGRSQTADLLIGYPWISRHHCEFRSDGDLLVVRDLGSKNGTWVNGAPIKEAVLKPGDRLSLGDLTFEAQFEEAEVAIHVASDAEAN